MWGRRRLPLGHIGSEVSLQREDTVHYARCFHCVGPRTPGLCCRMRCCPLLERWCTVLAINAESIQLHQTPVRSCENRSLLFTTQWIRSCCEGQDGENLVQLRAHLLFLQMISVACSVNVPASPLDEGIDGRETWEDNQRFAEMRTHGHSSSDWNHARSKVISEQQYICCDIHLMYR